MATMQKIISNLWFNGQAEEAVNYYLSIFKNSKIGRKSYYGEVGFEYHHKPAGTHRKKSIIIGNSDELVLGI